MLRVLSCFLFLLTLPVLVLCIQHLLVTALISVFETTGEILEGRDCFLRVFCLAVARLFCACALVSFFFMLNSLPVSGAPWLFIRPDESKH